MSDLKFSDLLLPCVSRGVGRDMKAASVGLNMAAASFLYLYIMKSSSDPIRLDLHHFNGAGTELDEIQTENDRSLI